jgi:hypothetical protein
MDRIHAAWYRSCSRHGTLYSITPYAIRDGFLPSLKEVSPILVILFLIKEIAKCVTKTHLESRYSLLIEFDSII